MGIEIRVDSGLSNELSKLVNDSKIREIVRRNGAEMQEKAMRKVPVDTGFLKRSIELNPIENGYGASVKATAHYASYVEYGTRFMFAQPYIRPSFKKQEIIFKKDMQNLLK